MEFTPRAAELTTLLESRITNYYTNLKMDEIGRVVSVGDGIARVYGLNEIQAGEMVEFASGVKGIALNLENENVGPVLTFCDNSSADEGDGVVDDAPNPNADSDSDSDSDGYPEDEDGRMRKTIRSVVSERIQQEEAALRRNPMSSKKRKAAAEKIMKDELEIDTEMTIPSLRDWAKRIYRNRVVLQEILERFFSNDP